MTLSGTPPELGWGCEMEERILITLRRMAWERAKGELLSLLETYWGEKNSFEEVSKRIEDFIKEFEDHW